MIRKNDIVVRISHPLEGALLKGDRAIVSSIEDDQFMTLEGHVGQFMISNFRLDSLGNTETKPTLSDLESMERALSTIDHWNRTHPTIAMVSIEAHCAQDGGSTFCTGGDDFNDIGLMISHLGTLATSQERKSVLRHAMGLLQVELCE